jgi:DNA topoisomerase-6 subunit A
MVKTKKMKQEKQNLKELGKKIIKDIDNERNPSMDVPVRTLSNVFYDEKNRILRLGKNTSKRYFFNVSHVRKFTQTAEVAALAKRLLDVNKHISLREVYYAMRRTLPDSNIDIVNEQDESNKAVEDLELITNLLREQLHINANKLGAAAGRIVIKDKGDLIDWSKLGSGGWSIPSNVEDLQFKKVNAKFIIYMEKAAVWERLHEDKLWDKMNCVIIASQGQATRGIRRLLKRMNDELKLPVYVLTDFDPWGIYIYSVLKTGSISLAHISERLAIPDAKFLGLSGDDIIKYGLKKHIIKFKDVDVKRIKQISKYEWFKNKKDWKRQFKLMIDLKGKVELDALVSKGITFTSDKYIPEKVKNKDFID